jgi:hemolysin III
MGWLCAVAVVPVLDALSTASLVWLLLGGVAYSVGTIFYHSRRIPFAHAIWHLFVLSGSACHFTAVFAQVVPV